MLILTYSRKITITMNRDDSDYFKAYLFIKLFIFNK